MIGSTRAFAGFNRLRSAQQTHRWREPDSNLRFRVKVTVSKPPSERAAKAAEWSTL
jgi:hypothetical protein